MDRPRRRWTCLVNINRRPEIAHGAGMEGRTQLCAVPHHSLLFLGLPCCKLGPYRSHFPLRKHHDREGCSPAHFPAHSGELCSSLDPLILFLTQCCAMDAWPKTSQLLLAFPARLQASRYEHGGTSSWSWQAPRHCHPPNTAEQVTENKSLGAARRQGSQLLR